MLSSRMSRPSQTLSSASIHSGSASRKTKGVWRARLERWHSSSTLGTWHEFPQGMVSDSTMQSLAGGRPRPRSQNLYRCTLAIETTLENSRPTRQASQGLCLISRHTPDACILNHGSPHPPRLPHLRLATLMAHRNRPYRLAVGCLVETAMASTRDVLLITQELLRSYYALPFLEVYDKLVCWLSNPGRTFRGRAQQARALEGLWPNPTPAFITL